MTRTQKIILVFVFTSLSLWRLFEIPAVANAFWAFCTVGALPWTDYIMSPKLVLKFLIMAFPLSLLIIFRKEFLAAVPHRQYVSAIELPPTYAPAAIKPKPIFKKSPVILVLPLTGPRTLPARGKREIQVLGRIVKLAVLKLAEYGVKSSAALYSATRALLALLGSGLMGLGSVAVALWRVLILAWRLAEPFIRQFDHWLDVTLHRSRRITLILDAGSESSRFIVDGVHKLAYAYKRTQQR